MRGALGAGDAAKASVRGFGELHPISAGGALPHDLRMVEVNHWLIDAGTECARCHARINSTMRDLAQCLAHLNT